MSTGKTGNLEAFLRERNEALINLDVDYVARKVPHVRIENRLAVLHKARYECLAIPEKLRHASGQWLRERGMHRMTGDALLPEGELPV